MALLGEELKGTALEVEDVLTDLQLMNMAQEIGPEFWRLVGLGLGFREPELAHLERNHRSNMTECVYQMLIKWRQNETNPNLARVHLRDALVKAKLGSVARQLGVGSAHHLNIDIMDHAPHDTKVQEVEIQQLRRELEINYKSRLGTTCLLPWDSRSRVAIDRYFTDVAITLEDTSFRDHRKIPLERHRHDIFTISAEKNLPINRILLRGEPGTGKSTVVAKIAQDWVSRNPSSPLHDLPLLFILSFQTLSEESQLGDAIRQNLLPEDTTFTPERIESLIRLKPHDSILILDGLEELSQGSSKADKTDNIVKILENRRLTECKVMVTARPTRVAQMKESTMREYTLLEIEGFRAADVFDFIVSYFGDDVAMAQGLMRHLEASPVILDSLCTIPLFCTIVCYLWETDICQVNRQGNRLGTNSELADHIIKCLWAHHESKNTEDEPDGGFNRSRLESDVGRKSRLSSFCSSIRRIPLRRSRKKSGNNAVSILPPKSTTQRLGKVALEKLLAFDEDLGFQQKDLTFCREFVDVGLAVGLLSKVQVVNSGNKKKHTIVKHETRVQFAHMETMQKCAAVYLACLWKKNRVKFNDVLKHLNDKFLVERFEPLLMLTCGEDANVAKEIIQHLSSLFASHDVILKCYFESPESQCVDEEMMRIFPDKCIIALTNPSVHSIAALGYFLAKSSRKDGITNAVSKLLLAAVGFVPMLNLIELLDAKHCPEVTLMSLSWCDLENTDTPSLLCALGELPALSELMMTRSTIGPTFIQNIAHLPDGCFKTLEVLELPIGTTCADLVLKAVFCLGQFPVLRKVHLTLKDSSSDIDCQHSDSGDVPTPPPELCKICLSCSNLNLLASRRFAQILTKATKLKYFSVVNSTLHPDFFSQLGDMLVLRKLVLRLDSWKGFELETLLGKCPNVNHVEVNTSSMGEHEEIDRQMDAIMPLLAQLRSLNTIHVSVGLGCAYSARESTVRALCESLKECKILNRVVVTGIKMTPAQGLDIINVCRETTVKVISLTACFDHSQDLSELHRLRQDFARDRSIVLEF
ncbi:uncharacterized protein [Diadema antillarum]|uniref:uncharacterized protein n=1 Tax=Diadema antillarum TaxID=105358 RepID=UPI003A893397